jgi:poly(A) polymerase
MAKLEHALSLAPDPVRRLGALAVTVSEDAERLRERLRLANTEYDRLAAMADGWWHISAALGAHDARALLYRLGAEKFRDRTMLAWSRSWSEGAADDHWHDLVLLPDRWTAPTFPLKAADFLARGVEKGPGLGAVIRNAEEAWIAQDFPVDAPSLDRIVASAIGSE